MKIQAGLVANLDIAYIFPTPTLKVNSLSFTPFSFLICGKSFLHNLTLLSSVGWPSLLLK